ncbi:unnamed protein product [Choristocarpus tenellus]
MGCVFFKDQAPEVLERQTEEMKPGSLVEQRGVSTTVNIDRTPAPAYEEPTSSVQKMINSRSESSRDRRRNRVYYGRLRMGICIEFREVFDSLRVFLSCGIRFFAHVGAKNVKLLPPWSVRIRPAGPSHIRDSLLEPEYLATTQYVY